MSFNEARKLREAIRQFDSLIPVMVNDMGQIALNHFKKSFRNQGFTDNSLDPWKPRKRLDRGRAILVKSGRLRRSLRKTNRGKYKTVISSNVPYAGIHNNGGRIQKEFNRRILSFSSKGGFAKSRTRAQRSDISYQQQVTINEHSINMPKRQFVGHSAVMNRAIRIKLIKRIRRVFPK